MVVASKKDRNYLLCKKDCVLELALKKRLKWDHVNLLCQSFPWGSGLGVKKKTFTRLPFCVGLRIFSALQCKVYWNYRISSNPSLIKTWSWAKMSKNSWTVRLLMSSVRPCCFTWVLWLSKNMGKVLFS